MNPYFLMVILYMSVAVLAALDSSLTSFTLVPWFNGLRWLRVHLITLGTLTEVAFGLLPIIVAIQAGRARPAIRWDIWLALNAGLITLLVGIPLVNSALILTGGTLIFIAVLLLMRQLNALRPLPGATRQPQGEQEPTGHGFYLAGLAYLLVGILVGTGLWLNWGSFLRIAVPIEVHIHANNWGFMSLFFAGLIVDLYPRFAGRSLAWPRSIKPIFWMMTLGALGLVIGPWVNSLTFSVPGLVLHLTATTWLLLNVIKPLLMDAQVWRSPGIWHLVTSYAWILAPVLVAPLIIFKVPGFPGAGIEQNAPQALIYGWALQFGYAIIPYLFARLFLPNEPARLGGNWGSLLAVHLGGVFLWASIFNPPYYELLHGIAYLLWSLSMLPIVAALWRIVRDGLVRLDEEVEEPSKVTFSRKESLS
jgi:cytochrome c oxidase cbb3-type subunit I